jgi:hypothetical protein
LRPYLIKKDSYLTGVFEYEEGNTEPNWLIKEIDFEGNEIRAYGEFTLAKTKRLSIGDMMLMISIPQSPSSIIASDIENEWLFHCQNSEYKVEVFDTEGRLFRVMDRPYTCPPFTAKEKQEFFDRYEDSSNKDMKKMVKGMELPSTKTVTERMLVDDEGNLWIFTQETKDVEGVKLRAADIFDTEGKYDARVWLEFIPEYIRNRKMYYMAMDEETGYRSLKRYKMTWIN